MNNLKQFDIIYIDLDPSIGREKQKIRPCLIVNNTLTLKNNDFAWVVPITSRNTYMPTDIILKTKLGKVTGVIDTVQIRALDLRNRQYNKKDELQDNLKNEVLDKINIQLKPIQLN